MQLNPGYATAHQRYSLYLMCLGRTEESLAEIKRALELDPTSVVINTSFGFRLFYARRYDEAGEQLHKTLEMETNYAQAHLWLGRVYKQQGKYKAALAELQTARQLENSSETLGELGHALAIAGRKNEALAALAELQALSPRRRLSPYDVAVIYVGLGDLDQAFLWLQRACAEHSERLNSINVNPIFDNLHSDPRFIELLRRIGLAP